MSQQTIGLLVGGMVPAVCYGLSNLFVKSANNAGIGTGPYMVSIGIAVLCVGLVALFIFPDHSFSLRAGSHAVVVGILWGIGTSAAALGVGHFGVPIGKIAPLFNANTIVTVLLALWIFSEWKEVHVPQLLLGTICIVAGAFIVSRA